MGAIDDLLTNNERYASTFEALPTSRPGRRIAVVACMDARLNVVGALGLRDGDAHVIRNAGGVVTDDVIRSLLISQRLLGTEEVMLVHHTDCGLLQLREEEFQAELEAEVGMRPPFALEAFADLDEDVRRSIARIRSSPFIPHTEHVRGFVFDVGSGRLREVTAAE